ncbi:sigma-54 interaction domain-containing protein [Bacillus piscicola]|uniref:sigma-54 interaction domain-containing protein n=1 Tax=Bacillus piscicola TaxID=1632684 RepID=UPI001F097CDA
MAIEYSLEVDKIVDRIYTDVIIVDMDGIVVFANDSTEHWFDMKKEEIIGRSVYELEKERVFYPSIARKVLETGEKQTMVQQSQNGKNLLVTGNMVYDEQGQVRLIACYSQDFTELEKLKAYIKKMGGELDSIKQELEHLKHYKENGSTIIARSNNMQQVLTMMNRVAETEAAVLFTGESGVGKSLLAEHLHQKSNRKGNFVPINCASIPESLLESELFGYTAGAFTGANPKGKKGLVEEAQDGTLFLDEIGELSFNLQAKLLQLIQEKTFYRIGDTEPREVNFRLITATHVDLEKRIGEGKFREDLFFRLSVIHIPIPSLKERQEDLLALIMEFTRTFNERYHLEKELSHHTIDCLLRYSWPGNVRELANIIERLLLTVEDQTIQPEHLPERMNPHHLSVSLDDIDRKSLAEIMRDTEIKVLLEARERCGSTTKMATYLGVSQPTVVRKLQKYGLTTNHHINE